MKYVFEERTLNSTNANENNFRKSSHGRSAGHFTEWAIMTPT
jgi:hypothetical protein